MSHTHLGPEDLRRLDQLRQTLAERVLLLTPGGALSAADAAGLAGDLLPRILAALRPDLCGDGTTWFRFDGDEARGQLGVSRGTFGPSLTYRLDEAAPLQEIGFLDLYYASPEGREGLRGPAYPQLIFDVPGLEEPYAKALLTPNDTYLIIDPRAVWVTDSACYPVQTFYSDGRDFVFHAPEGPHG